MVHKGNPLTGKSTMNKRSDGKKKPNNIKGKVQHPSLTLLNRNHTEYPDSPEEANVETFTNAYSERDYVITFDCPEFTSLCPVTGQPDFGHITIKYIADRECIESKALKLYLFSFRNHNAFHEAAVNMILTDLSKACNPRWMEVTGVFRPRGGIAITVVASIGNVPSR